MTPKRKRKKHVFDDLDASVTTGSRRLGCLLVLGSTSCLTSRTVLLSTRAHLSLLSYRSYSFSLTFSQTRTHVHLGVLHR